MSSSVKHRVVEEIRDDVEPDLVLVVSESSRPQGSKFYSFSVFKEFRREGGGDVSRTAWLSERHVDAVMRLAARARQVWERRRDLESLSRPSE